MGKYRKILKDNKKRVYLIYVNYTSIKLLKKLEKVKTGKSKMKQ